MMTFIGQGFSAHASIRAADYSTLEYRQASRQGQCSRGTVMLNIIVAVISAADGGRVLAVAERLSAAASRQRCAVWPPYNHVRST